MLDTPLPDSLPPAKYKRNDHLSPWSLILLGLVVIIQLFAQFAPSGHGSRTAKSDPYGAQGARADAKDILEIDAQAKYVYAMRYLSFAAKLSSTPSSPSPIIPIDTPPKSSVKPSNAPKSALASVGLFAPIKEAETQLREFPGDREVARRLMILRAEAGRDPLAGIAATRTQLAVPTPLNAFDASDPAQRSEADLWRTLFVGKMMPRGTKPALIADQIRAMPYLHWYGLLAMHQLWLRDGETAAADAAENRSVKEAFASMFPLTVLYCVEFLVAIGGLVFLVGLGARAYLVQGVAQPVRESVFDEMAMPLPDRIQPDERRLGPGDLFDIFVVVLVLFTAISYIMGYLPLLVAKQWLLGLDMASRVFVEVSMVTATQLLVTVVGLAVVLKYASKRGASVRTELGLGAETNWKNVVIGATGWAMSLPLVFGSAAAAEKLFKHIADPSNPAIPLALHSSGFAEHLGLYLTICVFAPIFEETLFRGVLYQTIRAKLGVWPGIIISSVIFGLVHPVSIVGSIPLMLLGGVLAWMAETRKSLLPGMVAHSLQNTTSFLAMLFLS